MIPQPQDALSNVMNEMNRQVNMFVATATKTATNAVKMAASFSPMNLMEGKGTFSQTLPTSWLNSKNIFGPG